jgi:hypothetical protein
MQDAEYKHRQGAYRGRESVSSGGGGPVAELCACVVAWQNLRLNSPDEARAWGMATIRYKMVHLILRPHRVPSLTR